MSSLLLGCIDFDLKFSAVGFLSILHALAEDDAVGQELHRQLDVAERELKLVQKLCSQATDNCMNLKKPD
ncbi:Mediator of RNA polymerase II transcription subunit 21 [Populus alba x Populus x berolinensis]|nr:Mediator of RNA polymerase II transcription subunit 21 [Populus alba x Populus x berolinensis]